MISFFWKIRKHAYKFGIVIGLILFFRQAYLTFQLLNAKELPSIEPVPIILAVGLVVLGIFQQIWVWLKLMNALGEKIPWLEGYSIYILSFIGRYIPGSIWGYLGRSEWLLNQYRIPLSKSNMGSLLEIGLQAWSSILVAGVYGLIYYKGISMVILLAAIVFLPLAMWLILKKVLVKARNSNRYSDQNPLFLIEQIQILPLFGLLGVYIINCIYFGGVLFIVGAAIGFWGWQLRLVDLFTYAGQYSIAWFIGFIVIIIPSGLGLREVTLTWLLVDRWHLSNPQGSTISILVRVVMILAEAVCIGLIWGLRWLLKPKKAPVL